MKFGKTIRAQGILIGLGAALLLASAARAQQEVEPTTFDVVPGEATATQNAQSRGAQNSEAAKTVKAKAAAPVATQGENDTTKEESAVVFTASEIAGILILLTGIGILVVSALVGRWPKRYRHRFDENKIGRQRA